jgi:hypothetical protein
VTDIIIDLRKNFWRRDSACRMRWSVLVATAAEDRLNFQLSQQERSPDSEAGAKLGFVVSRGVTRDDSDGKGHPLFAQRRDF